MKKRGVLLASAVAALIGLLPIGVAHAGDIYHDPVLGADMSAPMAFDGLYAGVSFGLMNANRQAFYPGTNGYRIPAGVFAGYNRQFTPWLVGGIEAQIEGAYEWQSQSLGYNAFVLGRVGVLTAPDFAVYEMAGLGLIDSNSAYALGVGVEQHLSDTFAVRLESLSFGQLSPRAGIANYKGVMGMKLMLGGVWYLRDGTATSSEPAPFSSVTTRFSGPYLGLYAGGGYNPEHNFFGGDSFYGWHITRFFQGGVAGWNYEVAPMLRIGGEVQAGLNYNTSGQVGTDAQLLARIGVVPLDGLMVYASGGLGVIDTVPAYALGGGVEYALWGRNALRLDALALGQINPGAPYNVSGFSAAKVTLGTIWHFD